jgi:hypothetical protein
MFRLFAIVLVSLVCTVSSELAVACSCAPGNLKQLYSDADVVYFAEVALIRMVTKEPVHNSQATYELEFRPLRIFKGRDPGVQKARYSSTYHNNIPWIPGREDVRRVGGVVNSCDTIYTVGEVFLILKKRSEPLGTIHNCSWKFFRSPSAEQTLILESLSK